MAKTSQIVRQLQKVLPKYTNYFHNELIIDAIVKAGSIATIKTFGQHNLTSGDMVLIKGSLLKNHVSNAYIDAGKLVLEFNTPHDKTLFDDAPNIAYFDYSDLASATIHDIPDQSTLILNHGVLPTGSGNLLEDRYDGFNGFHIATVTGPMEFSIAHNGSTLLPNVANAKCVCNYRIVGLAEVSRLIEHYEKQTSDNHMWLWVIKDECRASFTRESSTDATNRFTKIEDFYQELYQNVHLMVVIPTSNFTGGMEAIDKIDDIRQYLLKSVAGVLFNSGYSTGARYTFNFVKDSFYDYFGAYYVHDFVFEHITAITEYDIIDPDDSVAFKEVIINDAMQFDNFADKERKIAKTLL